MSSPRPGPSTPPVGGAMSPLGEEALWKKLGKAGLDEETVKRRDKAGLIAYITKLESEIYNYQHHMGLLILEKKEFDSKYEELKSSVESSEMTYKRERVAELSSLLEARKREENLKKALSIEKECVANLEKALHSMRVEAAESKVSYHKKLAEARELMESAQRRYDEAEEKLLAAKSLEAEVTRTSNSASRSLRDVETREDDLKRRMKSFESQCERREIEMNRQRQSLNDLQNALHAEQKTIQEKQALFMEREEYMNAKFQNLSTLEKRLEDEKMNLEAKQKTLMEDKSTFDLQMTAFLTREEAIIEKEARLDKRERDMLILQESVASKKQAEIQRIIMEQQSISDKKAREFEKELDKRRVLFEEEMDVKRMLLNRKESALDEREESVRKKEQALELRFIELAEKQDAVEKNLKEVREAEEDLLLSRSASAVELHVLQKEREDIKVLMAELGKMKASLENVKKEAIQAQEKHEITIAERNDLLLLEMKLKEEIDSLRLQKVELCAEADRLQMERERFEIEWDLIDEKKEKLQMEAAVISEDRREIDLYLKNEYDTIKQEKEKLCREFKSNMESLSLEHEQFLREMQDERVIWVGKMQQEREDFKREFDVQRTELMNSLQEREKEIEAALKEREEEFEQKKMRELEFIDSQKGMLSMQLERVTSELLKLENERKEIALEREQREEALSEMRRTVEILNVQREKLQEQRKLLHADREAIDKKILLLNKLEQANIDSESGALALRPANKCIVCENKGKVSDVLGWDNSMSQMKDKSSQSPAILPEKTADALQSTPAHMSWVRKCAEVIFKRSLEESAERDARGSLTDQMNQVSSENCQANAEVTHLPAVSDKGKKPAEEAKSVVLSGEHHTQTNCLEKNTGYVTPFVGGSRITYRRKRHNDTMSKDNDDSPLEPQRKHQKGMAETNGSNGEKTTSNGTPTMQELCYSEEHATILPDVPDGCSDPAHGNSASTILTGSKSFPPPGDLQFENGKAHTDDLASRKHLRNKDLVDDEDNSARMKVNRDDEQEGCIEYACDEEADDERNVTVKEKLWNFLIT